jgi:hypothetical protein
MIVLDANRTERTALSLQDQPVVVEEWHCQTTGRIVNLQVSAAVHGCRHFIYVTANGWVYRGELVLEHSKTTTSPTTTGSNRTGSHKGRPPPQGQSNPSMNRPRGMFSINHRKSNLTSTATDMDCQVGRTSQVLLYAPPKVAVYNAQGESIGDDPHSHSTPLEPIVSQFVDSGSVLFSKIPPTSKYLGHHDKYMVDYQPKFVRDTTAESCGLLLLVHGREGEPTTIPVKELPQSFVVHPGGEWMVLGTKRGLVLMAHRRW